MENSITSKSGSLSDSRRKFLEQAGATIVLSTFGAAFFTACSSTDDADPMNPNPGGSGIIISGNIITIDLTIQTSLNTSGNWLLIENASTLVVNVNDSFTALSSVCTHQNCTNNWSFGNNRFTCSCHGSQFDPSGRVLNGPATSPLAQYAAKKNGNTLTIEK